jgi:hypothetical protein
MREDLFSQEAGSVANPPDDAKTTSIGHSSSESRPSGDIHARLRPGSGASVEAPYEQDRNLDTKQFRDRSHKSLCQDRRHHRECQSD